LERRPDAPPVLSFGQERLWFLAQLDPADPSYLLPLAYLLSGPLDPAALEAALIEITRRHEVLRTTYRLVGDRPTPLLTEPSLRLVVERSPSSERSSALGECLLAESRAPLDLATEPPLRARLVQLGDEDHLLLITLHHIASDAWTIGILHRELGALYEAFLHGRSSPLPELPLQYVDYARHQRQLLAGALGDRQLVYWLDELAGASFVLDLPADHPRPSVQSRRGAQLQVSLAGPLRDALAALAQREGATLFMLLLAAFSALLQRYSGKADLLIGSPIGSRAEASIEELAGFFVNTLVLRARPSPELPFTELLAQIKETCLGAYAHHDLPFERLVAELDQERDRARPPLVQVAFALQNAAVPPLALTGLRVEPLESNTGTSKFDLSLWLADQGPSLQGFLEYSTDLFEPPTVERLFAHYVTLLEGLVQNPSLRVRELPLLGAEETQRLLVAWNQSEHPYPRDAEPGPALRGPGRPSPRRHRAARRRRGAVLSRARPACQSRRAPARRARHRPPARWSASTSNDPSPW
jgi:hypothetical protein